MSESNGNGVILKWMHIALILVGQVVLIVASFAVLKFQVEDHARRLNAIEKRQEDNFIPRQEYDKRHADLQEQLREIRDELRDLERKAH